ncbi:MAG: Transcriptional regulatory protein LiaR [bacterium]|nr:Transcriptional regulatory protein LiaR [bacterium]MCK6562897.1 response regulator transcription factor [bacterium]NUM65929.1 response regulator transcription factor [candidate division KSB1 bacterium]
MNENEQTAIKVAIVEDNREIREGLAIFIGSSTGYVCTATYGDAENALEHLPDDPPDVVLMDIRLPKMSGIECVVRLKEQLPELQIMMLTMYEDDELIFKSLVAGATGYVLKKTPPAELLDAIRNLHNGGSPISSQIARKVVQAFQQSGRPLREAEALTPRESEILSYLAKGYHDKDIANTLFVSLETVRTHVRNIYKKLHVRSRTEAVLKYLGR